MEGARSSSAPSAGIDCPLANAKHLAFPFGEHRDVRLRPQPDLVHQPGRPLWRHDGPIAGDLPDSVDQIRPAGILGQIPGRALLHRP